LCQRLSPWVLYMTGYPENLCDCIPCFLFIVPSLATMAVVQTGLCQWQIQVSDPLWWFFRCAEYKRYAVIVVSTKTSKKSLRGQAEVYYWLSCCALSLVKQCLVDLGSMASSRTPERKNHQHRAILTKSVKSQPERVTMWLVTHNHMNICTQCLGIP